jgi:hypothetical protein
MKVLLILAILTIAVGCSHQQNGRNIAQDGGGMTGGEVGNMLFGSRACSVTTGVQGDKKVSIVEEGMESDTSIGKISILSDSKMPRLQIEKENQVTYFQGGKSLLIAEFINLETYIYCDKDKGCVLTLGKAGKQTKLERNVAVNTPAGQVTVYNDSKEPRLMIEKDGQVTYLQGGKFLIAEFIHANTFIYCGKR